MVCVTPISEDEVRGGGGGSGMMKHLQGFGWLPCCAEVLASQTVFSTLAHLLPNTVHGGCSRGLTNALPCCRRSTVTQRTTLELRRRSGGSATPAEHSYRSVTDEATERSSDAVMRR